MCLHADRQKSPVGAAAAAATAAAAAAAVAAAVRNTPPKTPRNIGCSFPSRVAVKKGSWVLLGPRGSVLDF